MANTRAMVKHRRALCNLMRVPFSRGLAALVLAFLTLGCGGNRPAAGGDKGQEPAKAAERKPDFSLTAEEISREFLKDKEAAEKKYQSKLVEITGEVSGVVGNDGGKDAVVLLEGGKKNEKDALGTLVQVRVQPKFAQTALQLSRKQKVKITGEYSGANAFVVSLGNFGTLQELSKSAVVPISAPDLVAEFTKDAKAAAEKYASKEMIVSGELEDMTKKDGFTFAKLKGHGKTRVSVTMGAEDARLLQKGQTVRLRCGSLGTVFFEGNEVRLDMGMIVEAK